MLQFGTLLVAIPCPRPYESRQYNTRNTFRKKLASVHKKSATDAATATGVTSRSHCCSLEPFLQRYGAPCLTSLDNTIGAKRSKKICVCSQKVHIWSRHRNKRGEQVLRLQFGIRLAAIRCLRPYGSRQYHRREKFQQKWRLFTRSPQLKPLPQQA